MKKIEHFKSMAKEMAKPAEIVEDINDPNPDPAVSPDEMPVQPEAVLNKGRGMTPNTWFHYDHPEHGKIEVSAHHDGKKAHIVGVGAPGDVHIHPKDDAGMSDDHINAMSAHAAKLGPGQHIKKAEMKKSEWTAEEIVLQALKNVKEKQDLKKAEEMKRDEGKAEDTGAIYNEEQEVGNQNDIQEAAKRDHARMNGKKLKEYIDKAKNKSEKAAKSPIEDK